MIKKQHDIITILDPRGFIRTMNGYVNIYILSDEIPVVGDFVYDNYAGINHIQKLRECDMNSSHKTIWRKIIASTDILTNDFLPRINLAFTMSFAKNYDEGIIFDKCNVNYITDVVQTYPSSGRDCGGNERFEEIQKLFIDRNGYIKCTKL